MVWYDLFGAGVDKGITYAVLAVSFGFILYRKVNIALISLASAAILMGLGILSPWTAVTQSIDWNVIAIYWGYGMLAYALQDSRLPAWMGQLILQHVKTEKWVLTLLCALAALLSSFMANPVVVIMLAPLFIHIAEKFDGDLFLYLIGLAISSNVVTTVTMVADPPSLIMASKTNMKFLDFYWFQGRLGLGTISVFGIIAALLILLIQFRHCKKTVSVNRVDIKIASFVPMTIFLLSVLALSLPTGFSFWPGLVGLSVGLSSVWQGGRNWKAMIKAFDWNSIFFLLGIFVLISAVDRVGILKDLADWLVGTGMKSASLYLAIFVWLSVLLSSFIDNVPYTILMLPVCSMVAQRLGIDPFPFYFGMLVGTGIGGNVTPVGATANVLACGMLEQRGYRIDIRRYLAMSLPFSLGAVLVCHAMIQIFWL